MEDMEEKLKQYRLRKRRKEKFDAIKERIKSFLMPGSANKEVAITIKEKTAETKPIETFTSNSNEELSESESEISDEAINPTAPSETGDNKFLTYALRIVYFLFWTTLYVIAIELKFGIVFLMISALVAIYLNTRTGPKKDNEISAYSVFNKNCESIDGTLKAEQFERDLFFRADVK